MFKEYKNMKREMALLELQMENFTGLSMDEIITSMVLSGEPDGDRVQTSNISDKTCSVALDYRKRFRQENEAYYRFLYKRYSDIKKEIEFFENGISMLGGVKSEIMHELLEGELSWDEISLNHNISRGTLFNYRRAAIKELNDNYKMREEANLAYMLS